MDSSRHSLNDIIAYDSSYLPLSSYIQDNKASNVRKRAVELLEQKLSTYSVEYDPYIVYSAVNIFDYFVSRENVAVLCNNYSVDVFESIIMGSLFLAREMTRKPFPKIEVADDIALQNQYEIWSSRIRVALFISALTMPITTYLFLQHYAFNLNLDYPSQSKNLDYPSQSIVHTVSKKKVIYLYKKDIAFSEYKPSMIAASAVLFSIAQLYPSLYRDSKSRVLYICPALDQELLKKCLKLMADNTSREISNLLEVDG